MNRRKELQQMYKELKTEAGVYQIRNKVNGKIFIDTLRNVKSINGRQGLLGMGSHLNRQLQEECKQYGADAFAFEFLETFEVKDEPFFDVKDELKKLEAKWIEKLQPYEEHGYHKRKSN